MNIVNHMEVVKRKMSEWSQDEKDKLVSVFAWLIQEDKKQNPHLYKPRKT